MNPNSLVVWKRVVESEFVLGLIIDFILKHVSKTVHTAVVRCPRKPWTIKRLPSKCSEDKKKKAHQALVALMASQRRDPPGDLIDLQCLCKLEEVNELVSPPAF